jgi:predicted Fe-Mo cluster-binding NifX family protein
MKICITSQGKTLDSLVDPRFGRCVFFIIADTGSMEFEVIENINASSSGGAGIQSGQLVSEKDVEAVLTGNVGPNAFEVLNASNIKVITGVSGTIKSAIEKYNNGDLKHIENPNVKSHFGMGGGK